MICDVEYFTYIPVGHLSVFFGEVSIQNVVSIYNEILSLEKEGNPDTCHNMYEPWRHYAKWNKPVAK